MRRIEQTNLDVSPTVLPRFNSCRTIADTWEWLLTKGYAIVANTNEELGFDPTFCDYANATYFGESGILEPEQYDIFPPDRKRARGAVDIRFNTQGEISLQDVPASPVINKDRGHDTGQRWYKQTPLMGDKRFRQWLAALSGLIPPPVECIPGIILDEDGSFDPNGIFDSHGRLPLSTEREDANLQFYEALLGQTARRVGSQLLRQVSGTGSFRAGVNLLEVNRDVVSGPHQDNTCWNAITVIDKHGTGATSQLFDLYSPEPLLEYTLAPGQTLIINDRRYRHSATPLEPAVDGRSYRRAIVCTFDLAQG